MNKRKQFFKKLKDENYTILVPNMSSIHFVFLIEAFRKQGYNAELLTYEGREVKDEGLKNVHNDACYPALLVTGSYIHALKTGKYDLNKTAVLITQTGGGCRASNYLPLIKKAMKDAYPNVPVISLNVSGLEKEHSLPLNLPFVLDLMYAVLYGDLVMALYNQTKPYEINSGDTDKIHEEANNYLCTCIKNKKGHQLKKNYQHVIDLFKSVKVNKTQKVKVGVVGEIFVKYSSLANNQLIDFLIHENTEPVCPSLMEFILYCLKNTEVDYNYYERNKKSHQFVKLGYNFIIKFTNKMNKALKDNGYEPYDDFKEISDNCKLIIDQGVKMGEGWLIPSEMVTMAKHGINNIVCAQPFGCLPNHIVGKGMVRPIKKMFPNINIAPIDYDCGASKVNQENRIKLMLSTFEEIK